MATNAQHPYHPIIYVRGFAGTQGEIEETVADPYMGFNVGSTKARMAWTGDVKRYFFESPLVRLMSDHDYGDVFVDGEDLVATDRPDCVIPYRSIVIYRYYDEASKDFGTGETPPIEHFAKGLGTLILRLRDKVCADPKNAMAAGNFRVYLVAHSMGGLICRAFLQNTSLGSEDARRAVDKVFTYATPHNGRGAGDASDGLVRIENATTHGPDANGKDVPSPRAFVNRSHSGQYGIVNSEEGYQNLTRFLFGALRADGFLDIDDITLPIEVYKELKAGKKVRSSYQFEIAVSVRGCQWQMTRQEVRENSAIFRTYDELFPGEEGSHRPPDRTRSPHLFSVFLDPSKSVKASGSVSFAFDLKVLVPDYEVDGLLFMKRHYEGGYILRELILVEAFPDPEAQGGWRIKYGYQDDNPGKPGIAAETRKLDGEEGIAIDIPIAQRASPGSEKAHPYASRRGPGASPTPHYDANCSTPTAFTQGVRQSTTRTSDCFR
ncbi:hypothetical protein [Propionivibrio sp.]|uniref:esterase/lipase family protein n=1 Tax=Propionivibrio sp. TaxID=2212460 RepID=UPI0025E96FC8|nr:hypothetical protein [Propionivibrio sp.]MBK8745316.1 hypothetical protein [Propionivibrio sp.]